MKTGAQHLSKAVEIVENKLQQCREKRNWKESYIGRLVANEGSIFDRIRAGKITLARLERVEKNLDLLLLSPDSHPSVRRPAVM